MRFSQTAATAALVAMVSLSLSVAASLDPIEQHLKARDGDSFSQSKGAAGKNATPIDLTKVKVPQQAVLKLIGDDLHTPTQAETLLEASDIAVPAAQAAQADNRAHCALGHDSVSIKRIRYEMTMLIDHDESGATTEASSESVRGTVVKATSGLYSDQNPNKGACAKTLARHGEACATRPYVVPHSALLDPTESKEPKGDRKFGKRRVRSADDPPSMNDAMKYPIYVSKRDGGKYDVDQTASALVTTTTMPQGAVCVDTVKREKQVTNVVPTDAHKAAQEPGSKLYFELVRSDEKQGVWSQIIYDKHGKPVDQTHLDLSTGMSFWRAEYYCAECPAGEQKHTVLYEKIEIEVDEIDEHTTPDVQCHGQAHSTNVHRKEKSRYALKNSSGVEYKGAVFSIDRVTLGKFDARGKGASVAVTETNGRGFPGTVPVKDELDEADANGVPKKPEDLGKHDAFEPRDDGSDDSLEPNGESGPSQCPPGAICLATQSEVLPPRRKKDIDGSSGKQASSDATSEILPLEHVSPPLKKEKRQSQGTSSQGGDPTDKPSCTSGQGQDCSGPIPPPGKH